MKTAAVILMTSLAALSVTAAAAATGPDFLFTNDTAGYLEPCG